jgi:hypothetical protein
MHVQVTCGFPPAAGYGELDGDCDREDQTDLQRKRDRHDGPRRQLGCSERQERKPAVSGGS